MRIHANVYVLENLKCIYNIMDMYNGMLLRTFGTLTIQLNLQTENIVWIQIIRFPSLNKHSTQFQTRTSLLIVELPYTLCNNLGSVNCFKQLHICWPVGGIHHIALISVDQWRLIVEAKHLHVYKYICTYVYIYIYLYIYIDVIRLQPSQFSIIWPGRARMNLNYLDCGPRCEMYCSYRLRDEWLYAPVFDRL